MSAEILRLSDYRMDDGADSEIDLATAVDVAIRDLREILNCWGSEIARQRAQECESTLRRAYCGFIDDQTASQ
ncbi:MAG TPA: hypothetical protein VHX43_01185 [Xanthobacteraceae bacterium]|nr:hypothetical protein [Xanthobacteraceae bacterium]